MNKTLTVLVTRPQPEADRLCVRLGTSGTSALACPLVEIEYPAFPPIEYQDLQAVVATSKNGLRALNRSQYRKCFFDLPLFCIGKATAVLARTQGFTRIHQGEGTAQALSSLIQAHCPPGAGSLLHLAGSVLAWNLKGFLEQAGFRVLAPVIYHARATGSFPPGIAQKICQEQVDGIVLMSPRTTRIFIGLMQQEGMEGLIGQMTYWCLSEKVAAPLQHYFSGTRPAPVIAEVPTLDSLVSAMTIPACQG